MRSAARNILVFLLGTLAGCGADPASVTAPDVGVVEGVRDVNANLVAHASGGANWDLVGEFTGDDVPDVVGNVLGFDAKRYANGAVKGQIEYHQSFQGETFHFRGTVTCISVYEGNRAKFGGPITGSDDPTVPVGIFMWFTVVDNGQGANSPADRSSIFGLGDNQANEDFCASPALPNPRFSTDIASGNISVSG